MLVQAEKVIWFLHKSCMFKLQIPIDRHSPILIPNQCYLSDPPHFSLPSTFNRKSACIYIKNPRNQVYRNTAISFWEEIRELDSIQFTIAAGLLCSRDGNLYVLYCRLMFPGPSNIFWPYSRQCCCDTITYNTIQCKKRIQYNTKTGEKIFNTKVDLLQSQFTLLKTAEAEN